ncbi:hypothetical protein BABINDRAFT_13975 [Babjeviella inositovora NRRL Y-12698]|uniref:Uncharacterized protein n=1 Tax=Babjeviella inositovora NRRL Y-12698 TaxID=984486 RepID=A0A1E3QMQ8_9ASCO|nr:uncharacterized protein BABINDRAFT_13975 [Babjeviella inositovora NRRL Y-12698]ODQ78951.1 hypothetical protein BABINDRAFT_13975 [Babjeviella inositovora NRRL Y-12698]
MSFIARRSLSTLIPPKIASAANIGSNPNAVKMANVVALYQKLPKGDKQPFKATKYFDKDSNASSKFFVYLATGIITFGYTCEWYFHLRHHKHGDH